MSIDYSVNALLTSVKSRSMNADNQSLFTDADMVRIASESLQETIIPFIESFKEEYWVTIDDQTYNANVLTYTLPQRATGTKLRDVCLVDFQGNEVDLPYINPEDLKASGAYAPYMFGFYPRDNQIVLVLGNFVGASSYQYVRMYFFRRPNTLCLTGSDGNAGQVLSFDPNAQTITLDFAPTSWTTATEFDIINSLPPFQSRADNLTITDISGFVLTMSAALPSGLAVGDWVSEANFSPIPQIPVECQRLLEALTAARILQYSGDPSFAVFQSQAEQIQRNLVQVLSPRVDGSPQKIPIRNRLWGL